MRKLTSLCAMFVSILGGTVNAQFLINPYQFACPALTANTAVFDGTNDYLRKNGSSLTGAADGKAITFSCWVNFTQTGVVQWIFNTDEVATRVTFGVFISAIDRITVHGRNSAGTLILSAVSTTALTPGVWTFVYIALDLANSSNRHIYQDGTEVGVTWTTYTDDTMDLVPPNPDNHVGAGFGNSEKLNAALAELWFDDTYFNDPTKFRCSAGHPISLGSTGNLPTGNAPVLYLSLNGAGDSWAVDSSGNGNTFAVTGTLGTTTSP